MQYVGELLNDFGVLSSLGGARRFFAPQDLEEICCSNDDLVTLGDGGCPAVCRVEAEGARLDGPPRLGVAEL